MTEIEHRYAMFVRGLADRLAMPAPDIQAELSGLREAWAQPLPREHRLVRLPPDVWGRLAAAINGHRFGADPYDRFLPPAILRGLDATSAEGRGALESAWPLVQTWLAVQAGLSTNADSLRLINERYAPHVWTQQIDEGDDLGEDADGRHQPASDGQSETERGGGRTPMGRASEPAGRTPASPGVALPLDAAARRQLARLQDSLPDSAAQRVCLPAVLLGLWCGSLRIPRLASEWDEVRGLVEEGSTDAVESLQQVAAIRVSMLAENSIGGLVPDAWERLVTWAYARASRWAGQRTLDPVLHAQLIEGWRADPLRGEPVGPGLAASPRWSATVVEAITTGSAPEMTTDADVVVSRPASTADGLLAELDDLEGLAEVKTAVHELVQQVQFDQARRVQGLPVVPMTRHLVLMGNPGTGKTTVARLIGRILHAAEALPSATFLEVRRGDLVSKYYGETEKRVRRAIDQAKGGVLFIDEAHALASGDRDESGAHLLPELVAGMENQRDEFVLMLAGYSAPMQKLLSSDPGLAGRFGRILSFPDLSDDALTSAFLKRAAASRYRLADDVEGAARSYFARLNRGQGFANAREARSLFESAVARLASRYAADREAVDVTVITADDIPRPAGPGHIDEPALAQARAGIDRLAGLESVKAALSKVADKARLELLRVQRGIAAKPVVPGHFAFVGPPGTGKTTVARQLGQLFAALGVLRSGHVVAANRSTLVAEFIGQTAPKVREQVQAALDGVLFVDEAYALMPADAARDFGAEAVATLVEEMETHRERLVVVLAGYQEDVDRLLDANQGLRSRVNNVLQFEAFTRDELRVVADQMAADSRLVLEPDVADLLAERAFAARSEPGFANARAIRNLLDEAEGRLAARLSSRPADQVATRELSLITVADVPAAVSRERIIGFV